MNKFKNNYIVYILLLSFLSCGKSYYGYVYDYEKGKPVKGVKVNDYLNNRETITDSQGYFSLKCEKKTSSVLIFSVDGYVEDTIKSIVIHNGEFVEEKFKGEKIYLFSINSKFKDSIKKLNQNKY